MSSIQEVKRDADNQRLAERNTQLEFAVETLQESIADVVLKLDDIGWRPLGEDVDATEIPLNTIKDVSQTTRGLLSINPLIKRGLAFRVSYIHGPGVEFTGLDKNHALLTNPTNDKFFFSAQAKEENENVLGTDGNLFLLLTKSRARRGVGTITRVPMKQITGTVSDPDNPEDVWFYKREWETIVEDLSTGQERKIPKIRYYPATDYDADFRGRPSHIRNHPVEWNSAILHGAPNKQAGWKWGTPDLMTVIFWSKAYKEFLENSASLVKAYSRFAFKVQAPNKNGATAAATKVATPPSRDVMTGEVNNVGGTAVMGAGMNLQTIGRTAGSVDFSAGLPLAGMVAAGLDIPLTALTNDGGSSNRSGAETLEAPTAKAMKARQEFWKALYKKLFKWFGIEKVEPIYGSMDTPDVLRQIQAVQAAASMFVLSAEEVRELVLVALEIQTDKGMPDEKALGNLLLEMNRQAEQAEKAAAQQAETEKMKLGAQKKAQSADASYGDNSNRKAVGAHNYDKSDGAGPKKK